MRRRRERVIVSGRGLRSHAGAVRLEAASEAAKVGPQTVMNAHGR